MPPGINPCRACRALQKAAGLTPKPEYIENDISTKTVVFIRIIAASILISGFIYIFG